MNQMLLEFDESVSSDRLSAESAPTWTTEGGVCEEVVFEEAGIVGAIDG